MLRVGVLRFPGINCEEETLRAAERIGADARYIWHRDTTLGGADVVLIPGGFSYGDYLRAGAIARFSPVMAAVRDHAAAGGPVLGICNGFQILCEAQLLPGALMRNHRLRYVSRPVRCLVEQTATPFTSAFIQGQALELPIAHGDGRYVADTDTLRMLEAEGRVVLRYASDADNPNGAMSNIAGIMNPSGNVVGIMPHPERAAEPLVGNTDGAGFFTSIADWYALHQPVSHTP
ncbi:MAG TPA: phosphoribosylformylglycinamidine synthase subunit PurQ [Gemmatimonadales bacterium]|jgi:phosphoribosylformylglycinamidine synthase|nr:phosphoribosylformylglycinamidine synthase subunit PurQ [Gemmatimonadales bacterium]